MSEQAPTARRERRRLPWALLLVLAVLVGTPAYLIWSLGAPSDDTTVVEFEVSRGRGAAQIARDLHAAGLVREPRVFLLLLRFEGMDRRVGEGLYDLHPAMRAREVAAVLRRGGRPRTVRLVVPEGQRLSDVASRLEEAGLSPLETTLARMREPDGLLPQELLESSVAEGATLEGYLFPAAYEVPVDEPLDAVLGRMVRRFEAELDVDTRAELERAGLDLHTWVTLASMVQAEAGNDSEMPIIAGVFLNRLDLGMPLQSDPTVAYGLGRDLPELDFPGGDFDVDHPWNTYTREGMPAGPISNPGRAALNSVLDPERFDDQGRAWLYFLHGRDESGPVFRPNADYEGHLRDIAQYLRR